MLRRRGLSYKRIIGLVMKRYGVRLSIANISRWVRGLGSPYNGTRIPSIDFLRPSKELAYVIGVVAGDGYVMRRRRPGKTYDDVFIGLKVKDLEFAEEFSRCLAVVLNRPPPRPRWSERRFVVQVLCKALYELLRKPFDMEKLRRFIEHNRECKSMFLRGFFDSEGCVTKTGNIIVYNTDLGLLKYIQQLMESLGIETTGPHLQTKDGTAFKDPRGRIYKTKKKVYTLYVPAGLRLKFYRCVGFTIKRKQQRLEDYLRRTERLKPPAKPPLFFPQLYHDFIYHMRRAARGAYAARALRTGRPFGPLTWMGSISLGSSLVVGSRRVPRPAAVMLLSYSLSQKFEELP